MSIISYAVTALSMSADSFAASLAKGTAMQRPGWGFALKTGAVFGLTESCTFLAGAACGAKAGVYIEAVDHWIAYTVLCAIGASMIAAAFTDEEDETGTEAPSSAAAPPGFRPLSILLTAFGSSVDSMATGAAMALVEINIRALAATIAFMTFAASVSGVMAGRFLGAKAGKRAAAFSGCALIAIGWTILHDHLNR